MSVIEWIVLKKYFLGDRQNFLGPLMRLASGDVRDHIVSHKNDHGPSYRSYGAFAPAETSKNQHSRNFWSRSIFDFCNSIECEADKIFPLEPFSSRVRSH
jgi:hypothetical protein